MARIENTFLPGLDPMKRPPGGKGDLSSMIHNYGHAEQLFNTNFYEFAPKHSFLFHVKFDYRENLPVKLTNNKLLAVGMLVKSVSLPKFTVDNKVLNAYNRPNIVQSKIKYDPVTITFHDDNSDAVLEFWREYYGYYYRDSDYYGNNDSLAPAYTMEHKYADRRQQVGWGYSLKDGADSQQMLRAIRIYSLHKGGSADQGGGPKWTGYVLVNPIITSFQHGQHNTSENTTMEHTMTVSYETVSYLSGTTTEDQVPGFADQNYDQSKSPIVHGPLAAATAYSSRQRPFGARGILGPGGVIETGSQVFQDITKGNYGAAATKAWKSYNNNKGADFKRILRSEATGAATGAIFNRVLPNNNPNSNMSVPTASRLSQGDQAYQVDNQGFQNKNTNLAGVPGLAILSRYARNKSNQTPNNGIVSNGGSISVNNDTSAYSPRPGLPLDAPNGTTTTPQTYWSGGYSLNPMNDPPSQE